MNRLTNEQIELLHVMGITAWQARDRGGIENHAPLTAAIQSDQPPVATMDWKCLEATIKSCKKCILAESRQQTVFGVGSNQADLLFVGEAPGAQEDALGEPFVGRAGQLLDAMLASIGLSRKQTYIANILKCRPPNNRDPLPQEISCCTPYLTRQIELLQPKVLVALGRIAAHHLLETTTPLAKLRGKVWYYGQNQLPLMVTYHPAYLLRSPRDKEKSYYDLLCIKNVLKKLP